MTNMQLSYTPRTSASSLVALTLIVSLAGCANMSERQRGTAGGAAIGAGTGAILGAVTGGNAGKGAVVGGVIGAVAGNLWSRNMEAKRAEMERATSGSGIEIRRTNDDQLQVTVPNDLSFDVNSAAIHPQLRPVLDQFAQGLDQNTLVQVVGHTDSSGSDAINNPLSLARAQAVRDYLSSRGVDVQRMQVDGRGSREPVADNATESGRAKNRRVEIFLREPKG